MRDRDSEVDISPGFVHDRCLFMLHWNMNYVPDLEEACEASVFPQCMHIQRILQAYIMRNFTNMLLRIV